MVKIIFCVIFDVGANAPLAPLLDPPMLTMQQPMLIIPIYLQQST